MSNPNRTVAAARGRKRTLLEEIAGLKTEAEVDAAREALRTRHPDAYITRRAYRVGPRTRANIANRWAMRAYSKGE